MKKSIFSAKTFRQRLFLFFYPQVMITDKNSAIIRWSLEIYGGVTMEEPIKDEGIILLECDNCQKSLFKDDVNTCFCFESPQLCNDCCDFSYCRYCYFFTCGNCQEEHESKCPNNFYCKHCKSRHSLERNCSEDSENAIFEIIEEMEEKAENKKRKYQIYWSKISKSFGKKSRFISFKK